MNFRGKALSIPKMNSTNLYSTTTNIILQADHRNPASWQDLYRLIPYLRNSLCCVVCSTLVVDPYTPAHAQCQHHICRECRGGRKRIKPACDSCKDCTEYVENKRLRILMQCYRQMCITLMSMPIFKVINLQASELGSGFERGASSLIMLIKEGAAFEDDYKCNGGLPKSAYSILPCVYTNSASSSTLTQTVKTPAAVKENHRTIVEPQTTNLNSFYSVVYPGTGNKITLKRKPKESTGNIAAVSSVNRIKSSEKNLFKKPYVIKPKKGCRCGNATATPGKLTCCGQRCPCYVEGKPCSECRCRGCRNPHRTDGQKVVPRILDLQTSVILPKQPQSVLHGAPSQSQIIQETQLPSLHSPYETQISSHVHAQVPDINIKHGYSSMEMKTQFATTHKPFSLDMSHHYKPYKVISGYEAALSRPELLPVRFSQGLSEEQISVL